LSLITGYVTSDSGAIRDIYAEHHYVPTAEQAACVAIRDGVTDINSGSVYNDALLQGVADGYCSMDDVNRALNNTMRLRFQMGLFDPHAGQPYWDVSPEVVNTTYSRELSLFATKQSMVLLKNDNDVLPVKKGAKIAALGPHADATAELLGNYLGQICPYGGFGCVPQPYVELAAANDGGSVVFEHGCDVDSQDTSGFAAAVAAASAADVAIIYAGLSQAVEREGYDRVNISLPGVQPQFIEAILATGTPTVLVLINGGSVAIDSLATKVPAIVEAFYPGFFGAEALAEVVMGSYNPGGKLPVTMYDSSIIEQANFLDMDIAHPPGRTYRYYTGTPSFPFGHGLSYTTFEVIWNNQESAAGFDVWTGQGALVPGAVDSKQVTAKVTNTGSREGDEIVFLFVKPQLDVDAVHGPVPTGGDPRDLPLIKQLVGF